MSKIFNFLPRHSASSPIEFAGDPGLGAGQEPILIEDAVDERGLARVRPPQHRDAQGLAWIELGAVLLVAQGQRRGLALLVLVETRLGRQDAGERVIEFAQALAVLGGEGDRIAEAEAEGFINPVPSRGAFSLVGDHDDRFASAMQALREMPVGGGETRARVDDEQDRVAIDERGLGLRAHPARERSRIALLEARSVDDGEGKIG